MKTSVDTSGPLHKTIQVELPWSMVSEELERAYKELAREVNIKGFRKGKVPRSVLRQRFGRKVEDEVIDRMISESYEAVLIQHRIQPVARPELERGTFKPGQPYAYTARVEVRPEIELTAYWFPIQIEEPKITSEMVDADLDKFRDQRAVLVSIEDRDIAGEGDMAILDYQATFQGKPLEGGGKRNHQVEIGSGKSVPGFEQQIIGMRVGSTKEFDLTFPEDWALARLAGQEVHFELTLQALKTKELPQLNDEFVKDLGREDCSTLVELREIVEQEIHKREKDRLVGEAKQKLIDQLIEANPFPVPPSLVHRQQEAMTQEMEYFLAQQGMALEQVGLTRGKVKKDMEKRAEREVRAALLLSAIADKENIQITENDIQAHLNNLSQANGKNMPMIKALFNDPSKQEELRYKLRQEKLLDYLLDASNMDKGEKSQTIESTQKEEEKSTDISKEKK